MPQVDAEINGKGARRLTVGEMLVGRKGLFKGGYEPLEKAERSMAVVPACRQ